MLGDFLPCKEKRIARAVMIVTKPENRCEPAQLGKGKIALCCLLLY